MKLVHLQNELQRIYGICVMHSVDDFLLTDADTVRRLDTSENTRETREKLLLRVHEEELDISLYVDRGVVERLLQENPLQSLHQGNLSDFTVALEGVSHFVYLLWNVHRRKSVTLLELEMQAEIDKYVTVLWLLNRSGHPLVSRRIRTALFSAVRYDRSLDTESLTRYRDANFLAAKYCCYLERRFLEQHRKQKLVGEVREFYRLPQTEKVSRIRRYQG